MLLTQISIKNFRGIEELTIPLEQCTVLIGENNAGKTIMDITTYMSLLQEMHWLTLHHNRNSAPMDKLRLPAQMLRQAGVPASIGFLAL